MTGHLEKRSKSGWRIVIEGGRDARTGARRRIVHSVRGNRRRAEEEMHRLLHELEAGTYVEPSKLTLTDYLRRWLQDYCEPRLAPNTIDGYRRLLEGHIIPRLGALKLRQLQPLHLQDFYSEMLRAGRKDGKGGLSARSVQYMHRIIHEALGHAVKWQLVARNVADAAEAPRPRRPSLVVLDVDGARRLLRAAEGHPDEALVRVALLTGLRRGELLALRWTDMDLAAGQLRVTRAATRLQGRTMYREPKSSRSRRAVALPASVVAVLKVHRKRQLEERLRLGVRPGEDDLVFCRPDARPLDPSGVSHRLRCLASAAGVPGLRFHDLRHACATLMLAQGTHPKVVQERLGHETITTTMDIYSHVLPGLQEEAASRLDDLIGGS